jgi:hypothetical protein
MNFPKGAMGTSGPDSDFDWGARKQAALTKEELLAKLELSENSLAQLEKNRPKTGRQPKAITNARRNIRKYRERLAILEKE